MFDGDKPAVLFLCTANSCRSQMAEGWLRHLAGDQYEALSAGLEPRPIHPLAIETMAKIGIDISSQRSKSVAELLGRKTIRVAVFVCAKAERDCPVVYPFAVQSLSWPLDDPAEITDSETQRRNKFEETRDRLGQMIRDWLDSEKAN